MVEKSNAPRAQERARNRTLQALSARHPVLRRDLPQLSTLSLRTATSGVVGVKKTMHLVLASLALAVANAHYVWQTNDGKETVVSFSEAAGQPGNKHVLQAIAPILSGAVTPLDNSTQKLEFAERDGEATGVLAAPLPGGAAAVEAAAPYGQFKVGDDLVDLKYYTSASVASKPNDWFAIQDALKNELEVTIRDPYQATPVVAYDVGVEDKARAGDQCPHGSPTVDGDACVIAVVRFKGRNFDGAVNVTTFDASGAELRTSRADDGVVVVRAPGGAVFARVNYREAAPKGGLPVDHWATTYAKIDRGADATEGSLFCDAVAKNRGCCLACGYKGHDDGSCTKVLPAEASETYCESLTAPSQRGCCSYCGHAWSPSKSACVDA